MNENQVDSRLVFVDVEAVGSVKKPHVIQIAAIATDSVGNEIAGFEAKAQLPAGCRVKPKHPKYCRRRWASEGQASQTVAKDFAAFLTRNATVERFSKSGQLFRVAQLVAHNANFDGTILKEWHRRNEVYLPAAFLHLCTLQKALWYFQRCSHLARPKNYKLKTLADHFGFGLSEQNSHDAFADVRATVLLFRALASGRDLLTD